MPPRRARLVSRKGHVFSALDVVDGVRPLAIWACLKARIALLEGDRRGFDAAIDEAAWVLETDGEPAGLLC